MAHTNWVERVEAILSHPLFSWLRLGPDHEDTPKLTKLLKEAGLGHMTPSMVNATRILIPLFLWLMVLPLYAINYHMAWVTYDVGHVTTSSGNGLLPMLSQLQRITSRPPSLSWEVLMWLILLPALFYLVPPRVLAYMGKAYHKRQEEAVFASEKLVVPLLRNQLTVPQVLQALADLPGVLQPVWYYAYTMYPSKGSETLFAELPARVSNEHFALVCNMLRKYDVSGQEYVVSFLASHEEQFSGLRDADRLKLNKGNPLWQTLLLSVPLIAIMAIVFTPFLLESLRNTVFM